MFLKSLTLKGFKSFADRTTIEFEPGVSVVVGPNGSGKSNLVDAVAWVLGAQGPRTLRGGKMDDVIFAGTPKRPSLGRAEVALTIDNSAGLLPIEFDEVTITRLLFRSGDSEYQINGAECRLLDIQELLSDTGIGRQQHVIVGQGQLDAVLTARPEDRRAIIEEAAGVLKFRKRRERAERRLESTEGNLLRLQDLIREVRRQLKPLERQADAARRHGGVEAELRAIKLHLAGHHLAGLATKLDRLDTERSSHARREAELSAALTALDDSVVHAEEALTGIGDDDVADALARAEAVRERSRGLVALVEEKRRGVERDLAAAADEGVVETLVAQVDDARRELEEIGEGKPGDAEAELVDATRARRASQEALDAADTVLRAAETELQRWRARADALESALDEAHVAAGAERLAGLDGVVGPLVDHIEIEEGAESAVASALGESMHAVVVENGDVARSALRRLKEGDTDALMVVLDDERTAANLWSQIPGGRPLNECVRAERPGLADAVARLLAGFVLVDGGWSEALDLALEHPGLVTVTADGDRFGSAAAWRVGGGRAAATRAALGEARAALEDAERAVERASSDLTDGAARLEVAEAREREAATAAREVEMLGAARNERRDLLAARVAALEERLARDPEAQAEAENHRRTFAARADYLRALAGRLGEAHRLAEGLYQRLREQRRRQSEAARAATGHLQGLRNERGEAERELREVRERSQRIEIDEAETKLRHETAVEALRSDFDLEPAAALDAPRPEVPEGTTLSGRARELERELRLMGPINPLALEEYESLQERHDFLGSQLEDVRESRRELKRVIRAVDSEIVSVFTTAYADVEGHFESLFSTLFPGGSGSLSLTDPDDPLSTGIEIDARPSGKNVRRLSLLSGGERSLTALAFLFAVFRARPSPFYLLDEVEAALDDVNLHRFLDLVHEFRDEAQLVVVSHQKRTMEAADCLHGVSMPPGGSSIVVSERLDDRGHRELIERATAEPEDLRQPQHT
ncbi:MAG: AAA family ATPase [Acidimicrobiia bacterium]|nr:AAA family ATPase [Acidimicrobiia bacterium]